MGPRPPRPAGGDAWPTGEGREGTLRASVVEVRRDPAGGDSAMALGGGDSRQDGGSCWVSMRAWWTNAAEAAGGEPGGGGWERLLFVGDERDPRGGGEAPERKAVGGG